MPHKQHFCALLQDSMQYICHSVSARRVASVHIHTFWFALVAKLGKQCHKFLVPERHGGADAQAIHPGIISLAGRAQGLLPLASQAGIGWSFVEGPTFGLEQRHSLVHDVKIVHRAFFVIQAQRVHALRLREGKGHVVGADGLLGLEVDLRQVGHVQDVLPLPHQGQYPLLQGDELRDRLRGDGVLHAGGADLVEVLAQHCQQLARGVLLQGLGEAGQLAKLALPTPDKTGSERLDMQLANPTPDKPVSGEAGQLAKLALPTPDKTGSERLDMQLANPTPDKPVSERLDNLPNDLPTLDKTGDERLDMQFANPTPDKPGWRTCQTCSDDTGQNRQ